MLFDIIFEIISDIFFGLCTRGLEKHLDVLNTLNDGESDGSVLIGRGSETI